MLEKYFTVHMKLMKDWGDYSPKEVKFGPNPVLFCYLPEGFFLDLIDAFTEILKSNPRGAKTF